MIQTFSDWLIYDLLNIKANTHLGESLNFFVYDTIKIILLLLLISFIMGIINTYFPVKKLRNFLSTRKLYGFQYLLASVFGSITPFCSCSSIPLFIGLVKGGIPLGVTFSFLITSPLVNEVAIAMFAGSFGYKVTIIYVASCILFGSIGGFVLGKMNLAKFLSPWVQQIQQGQENEIEESEYKNINIVQRLPNILKESLNIVRGVIIYVIIGIAIGAGMHGYVPDGFFETYLSGNHWYAIPIAVILAVPMYSNAAGIIPVIQVFVTKGVSLGTALAFMMAVVGLSLPEATMLKKVMTMKLILIFFGTIALSIMILGWLFNLVL
ncbi:MAG: permease [Bacteroidales bacterium]|nr:permease [Candidatus Scybalousia scybalohippi]